MDKDIDVAVRKVIAVLSVRHPNLSFRHQREMLLTEAIDGIRKRYSKYADDFSGVLTDSSMRPDGGFLYAIDGSGKEHLILVAEVKRQGTNDKRKKEGLPKQSKGNAIERLGKNLTGIRAMFKHKKTLPFVCFGSGHDFLEGSSIRDRVVTINEFFPLNIMFVSKEHPHAPITSPTVVGTRGLPKDAGGRFRHFPRDRRWCGTL